MKTREEKIQDLKDKIFQVYGEYLEECAENRVEISDVFNAALQALALQTTSIILQVSVIVAGDDAVKQKKVALDSCDKHYRTVRNALPALIREAHLHASTRQKRSEE